MKKLILALMLTQTILSCAQNIRPLNTVSFDMIQGDYEKDINNEFNPYLGTWEATWNNKKITLYLSKVTHHYQADISIGYYYEDLVIGKYKIVDLTTGATLEDTTNITNIDNITVKSVSINRTKNFLRFLYMQRGVNAGNDCGILSNVNLHRDLSNPNILTYKYYVIDYETDNCPYSNINDIPVNIPKQDVVLHKL